MTFSVTDRAGLLSVDVRQHLERRFLFALSRYDSRIIHTEVGIALDDTETGAAANQCQVTVKLQRASLVSIIEKDTDLGKCISRAAGRTGRAVARSLGNAIHSNRSRSPDS